MSRLYIIRYMKSWAPDEPSYHERVFESREELKSFKRGLLSTESNVTITSEEYRDENEEL